MSDGVVKDPKLKEDVPCSSGIVRAGVGGSREALGDDLSDLNPYSSHNT
jgi:hypothetical protein